MNMGGVEPYRITNEYNIAEILNHFGSEYILGTLEDRLNNIDYTSVLTEPNIVAAFETNFRKLQEDHPGDAMNVRVIREEVYRNIIDILTRRYNLQFNTVDDTIDIYTAAYMLYDFLICNRKNNIINFFTAFIINNKDALYNKFNTDDLKKSKDNSIAYGKRIYVDQKYVILSANISKIVNYISTLDITFLNVLQSTYTDYNIVAFLDNAFADNGNFFRDHYCQSFADREISPILIVEITMALQRAVGDIQTASHFDELIYNS